MKAQLYYWDRSQIKGTEILESNSEIQIFETFYKKNNELRYCNGSYYTFTSNKWEDKYNQWLKSDDYKAKSFQLYYGNGIVD